MSNCPICGSAKVWVYHSGSVPLALCRACGLKFQDPMPSQKDLEALYDGDYYRSIYPDRVLAEQKRMFHHRLEVLQGLTGKNKPRVLEIGSGRGLFLEVALERGLEVLGQDISSESAQEISHRLGLKVSSRPLEKLDLPHGTFDLVHMNHVLEHIPNLDQAVAKIRDFLAPGGIFYCEVPRQSNLLNSLSGIMSSQDFGFTYHPGHIYLFSKKALIMLLSRHGLKPEYVRIEGMADAHRFVRGVHYQSYLAHAVKVAAGGLRLERWLGGGNLVSISRKPA